MHIYMGKWKHGKDNSYLCDDLEGRDAGWEGSSKKGGDIYIYTLMAYSRL